MNPCPICGKDFQAYGIPHRCSESGLKRHESELRKLDRDEEEPRTFSDKLADAKRLVDPDPCFPSE